MRPERGEHLRRQLRAPGARAAAVGAARVAAPAPASAKLLLGDGSTLRQLGIRRVRPFRAPRPPPRIASSDLLARPAGSRVGPRLRASRGARARAGPLAAASTAAWICSRSSARPRAGLQARHGPVEAQRVGPEREPLLHAGDHAHDRLELRALEPVTAAVEVADRLEHERADGGVAVVARRARGRDIPVAPRPDAAVRADDDVLRDVTPGVLLRCDSATWRRSTASPRYCAWFGRQV